MVLSRSLLVMKMVRGQLSLPKKGVSFEDPALIQTPDGEIVIEGPIVTNDDSFIQLIPNPNESPEPEPPAPEPEPPAPEPELPTPEPQNLL